MSAGGQRSSRFAITIHEQDAVGGQVFAQSALLVDDPFQIAEMFQMFTADLRDQSVSRGDLLDQRGQFAGMIGAGFQNRRPVRGVDSEEAQRYADVVVEAGLGTEGRELSFEQGREQFLGGCLAVGAGHTKHWN